MGGDPPGGVSAAGRVLVTGGAGTVAGALVRTRPAGVALHLTEHRAPVAEDRRAAAAAVHGLDLADADAVADLVVRVRPDVVVHTAYRQSSRRDIVDVTDAVARACALGGAPLVHLSTDAVFGGDRPPYAEGDLPDPVHDYGRWKALAEEAATRAVPDACTTRTSLVVSLDPPDPATRAFADAVRAGERVTLFHDEYRQPILADDLAAQLWALVALPRARRAGVWHLPGPEVLSRLQMGERLARALGLNPAPVVAASAADHPSPRPRDLTMLAGRCRGLGVPLHRIGG